MESTQNLLRILVIVNLPWDERLGATRVWMELMEEWRALGHVVEKYSLSDAFPGVRASRVTFALRQLFFIRKAARFVRENGSRFDVIDALIGTLPFSRKELGFEGVIVARSVGLYLLYERFEQSVAQRWPRPARGKLAGHLLYRFTRRRLLQASDASVRKADLTSVPNEEEAICLRKEFGQHTPIIVQPYGLTESRRAALERGAAASEARLALKRVCFIGMWSARKGAHDWARIIERVRKEVPLAGFRFLGTMIDPEVIRAELGPAASSGIDFISDYSPDELPALLSDCAVGAFPSYVEGFGLAVIEQLAAGIPTVAYETAGPSDILGSELKDLLVPSGDIESFAAAICRVLRLQPAQHRELAERSKGVSAGFSWPKIARDTIQSFRGLLGDRARPILFVQPFSVGSAGGGARILRALLAQAPLPWWSICSSPGRPEPWRNETHLPSRPSWRRVEYSRLAALPKKTAPLFAAGYRQRLKARCLELGVRAIHTLPHGGLDFAEALAVARDLSLPFFLSVHDDLAYTSTSDPERREAAMRAAWEAASARFVISEALGREYCRRYGALDFQVVTDGLTRLVPSRAPTESNVLRIYFMGLFHRAYEQNLRALLDGVAIFRSEHPEVRLSVVLRCEHIRPHVVAGAEGVTVLPFADQAQVERDMQSADLLYMPIHFGEEHANFARYSLSTKMVTYIGSGVPILYHGPRAAAAFDLLEKQHAAILITTLVPSEIASALGDLNAAKRNEVVENALALAQREFMLADQARKFWGAISLCLASP